MASQASTLKSRTLHAASRALRRAELLSADLRARVDRLEAPPAPQPGSEQPNGRYGPLWNPIDTTEAIAEIYNTTDMASFERGGRFDADWIGPFLTPSSVVLDLGCGIGRVAKYVAPLCGELLAVDASGRMLQLAARRLEACPNVRLLQSDDTRIPAPDASVDLAYSLLVLQHVEREDAYLLLEELHRVLKEGGRAMLTFPNLLSDTYLEGFLSYAHSGASTQPNRARIYTPQEVERLMSAAGFACEIEAGTEIRVVATSGGR